MPKNVLVVDDSAMMRKIVIKNLRESGYPFTAVEAADGNEALRLFNAGGVDLILCDWNMPNMDGLEMVRQIRKSETQSKVPIVMITTEGSIEHVKEAILAGATNYLAKPFTPERFKEKLGKFLT